MFPTKNTKFFVGFVFFVGNNYYKLFVSLFSQ